MGPASGVRASFGDAVEAVACTVRGRVSSGASCLVAAVDVTVLELISGSIGFSAEDVASGAVFALVSTIFVMGTSVADGDFDSVTLPQPGAIKVRGITHASIQTFAFRTGVHTKFINFHPSSRVIEP
jgi:hypothetical protein